MPPQIPESSRIRKRHVVLLTVLALFLCLSIGALFVMRTLALPPGNFPVGIDITITEGLTQSEATDLLKRSGIVRSSFYLYLRLSQLYPGEFVQAGTYRFKEPLGTDAIARSLVLGENRSPLLRFTLPEGFHAAELATYLPDELSIEDTAFLKEQEGYLFPDTYFVSPETTLEEIVVLVRDTFNEKIEPLLPKIAGSGFTLEEVITLASILEREANDPESKKLVSGILQNRLDIGMALQVDAVFDYLLGKTSAELTQEDLDIDSPYNTYKYPGLPPGPISNPGIESILAVLEPAESDYLYYLTGNDGNFYYAKTFEEHKRNKERYLR